VYSSPSTTVSRPRQLGADWGQIISGAVQIGASLFSGGSNPRSGGSDPCCPPGFNPPSPWPVNSGKDGAPPDYRTKGSPFEDPSPSGTGRKKDDFCDCIPFSYNGAFWMVGTVDSSGAVRTGLPTTGRESAVWVEVSPTTHQALRVPGVGSIVASSGGNTGVVTDQGQSTQGAPSSTDSVSSGGFDWQAWLRGELSQFKGDAAQAAYDQLSPQEKVQLTAGVAKSYVPWAIGAAVALFVLPKLWK